MIASEIKDRKMRLRSTYRNTPQLGLVLGAGVTALSGVPTYNDLALRLLELASERELLSLSAEWVTSFVRRQRELHAQHRRTVQPEEVVLFVRTHLEGDEKVLRKLVHTALYERSSVGQTVGKEAFKSNRTLDSILSFCAARPNTVLAPSSIPPATKSKEYEIEANIKVGGILTTNYDNLVEGAFHTKYRRNLLKPVGRPGSAESQRDRRLIPVYHIHGYLGYRDPQRIDTGVKTPEIVIAEDDYFQVFYDPLGFGNYIAMSFLRRFPCLFIGSSMADRNLRRFLFHLARDLAEESPHRRKFAILKTSTPSEDEFTDAILQSYGVETIWVQDYDEVGTILRETYTAIPGADWDYVADFTWA